MTAPYFSGESIQRTRVRMMANVCPITLGTPTRMTESGARTACDTARGRRQKESKAFAFNVVNIYEEHCKKCGGQYPPELTIIRLEDVMSNERKRGTCAICGEEKNVMVVSGKNCCGTCEHYRRGAKNRPDLVAGQLKELSPDVLVFPVGESDQADEIQNLKAMVSEVGENNISLVKSCRELKNTLETLQKAYNAVTKDDNQLCVDLAAARRECNEISANLEDVLKERDHFRRKMVEVEEVNINLSEKVSLLENGIAVLQAGVYIPCTDVVEMADAIQVPVGYESLGEVLSAALNQAAFGKGKERHANDEPFEEQEICSITRGEGHGFTRGQAKKKISEAKRLDREAAIRELLGAINYLAADIIVLGEVA